MKLLGILMVLLGFAEPAFADLCICQYPKEDAIYGAGVKGEIGFYKMGCAIWLGNQPDCRREKVIDINRSLEKYLDKVVRSSKAETIRIGYVGHWSSSEETVEFIDEVISPILKKYRSPISIENTACFSMDSPELVQNKVQNLASETGVSLRFTGTQTTSIGVWDDLSIRFRRADLVATADSSGNQNLYPNCEKFEQMRCTGFQVGDKGFCLDQDGDKRELICLETIKEKKSGKLKLKKSKRWTYLDEAKIKVSEYEKQTLNDLRQLKWKVGN